MIFGPGGSMRRVWAGIEVGVGVYFRQRGGRISVGLGEFPSGPRRVSGRAGGEVQPRPNEFHPGWGAGGGEAGVERSPAGPLSSFGVRGGGNSRQGWAGPTAWGLQGRSSQRAAVGPLPSRSQGNLLLEKWAGGGDGRGPSLASARVSGRPFHPRGALPRGPSLCCLSGKKKVPPPPPPRARPRRA